MDYREEPEEQHVVVPQAALSKDALEGLIDEFILREGTDYGHQDVSIQQKRRRIHNQLVQNHIQIVFSSRTQDCTLMKKEDVPKG